MAVEPKADTSKTVCVACKLPHGLELRIYEISSATPPEPPKLIEGDSVVLAGSNAENAIGGYGFTYNVDAEFFRTWMAQNQNFPAVRARLIFAEEKPSNAHDRAREQSLVVSGFEGINPEATGQGVVADKYEGRPAAATKAT